MPTKERYDYHVQGKYPSPHGWEDLTSHPTRADALDEKRVYDENEPGVPHRVIYRRDEDEQ